MNQRLKWGIGVAAILVLGLLLWQLEPRVERTKRGDRPCPGEERPGVMKDVYLRGILEKDAAYTVTLNWYDCNPVRAGDLVLYRYSDSRDPVIRVVRGAPGDHFRVVERREEKAWSIEINGDEVQSAGKRYLFGAEPPPPLRLAENARQGKLGEGEVILLSAFPPGDSDSGVFGVVSVEDLLGRVVPRR